MHKKRKFYYIFFLFFFPFDIYIYYFKKRVFINIEREWRHDLILFFSIFLSDKWLVSFRESVTFLYRGFNFLIILFFLFHYLKIKQI